MPLGLSLENLASQAALDAHIADTSAAHAASAIAFTPTGTIAATDVQAAIAEVAAEAGGGGGPELLDLGTVDVTDLLAGPVTVHSVAAGEVVLGLYASDYTAPDVSYAYVYVAGLLGDGPRVELDYNSPAVGATPSGAVSPGADIRASVSDFETGPWAAATVYPANAYVIEAGHLWFTDGGTSGGSEPDFAGNIGGTVGDNGMTWTDDGAVPTTGSVHVYALIATPAVP